MIEDLTTTTVATSGETISGDQRAEVAGPKLNDNERKVLAKLASGGEDFGYFWFSTIASATRLNRRAVRRACRSLARKGLAQYARGLWSEDGLPCGSGYTATKAGRERADEKLVERYVLRSWQ